MSDKLPKTAITPATHTVPPAKFSHGVKKGNILQVAGQVGFGPAVPGQAPAPVGPTLREQAVQTLRNVQAVLQEGGSSWEDVVMVRVYLTDTAHFAEFNEIYDEFFADLAAADGGAGMGDVASARTTVYVDLPAGLLVEIDALAVLG
jgi:enamine deaminase RidA (YjgF/YER057c/UK114 family)